jgi:hypothetical protein
MNESKKAEKLQTAEEVKNEIFNNLGLTNVLDIDHQLVTLLLERWQLSIRNDQVRQEREDIKKITSEVFADHEN